MKATFTVSTEHESDPSRIEECLALLQRSTDFAAIALEWLTLERGVDILPGLHDDEDKLIGIYFVFMEGGKTIAAFYAPISDFVDILPTSLYLTDEIVDGGVASDEFRKWAKHRNQTLGIGDYDVLSESPLTPPQAVTPAILGYIFTGCGFASLHLSDDRFIQDCVDEEYSIEDLRAMRSGFVTLQYQNFNTGWGFCEQLAFHLQDWVS